MGDKFTVAGARGTQNLYLLDGVSNADLSGNAQGSSGSYMGSETVQEIQIVTNNYSAEYRSAAGGIVSAVTKSGTNTLQWRGLRVLPQRRARRRPITSTRSSTSRQPEFERNQFGGCARRTARAQPAVLLRELRGAARGASAGPTRRLLPSMNVRQGRLANGRTVAVNPIDGAVTSISIRCLARATRSSRTSATRCWSRAP